MFGRLELGVAMEGERAFHQFMKYFSVALLEDSDCELGMRACLVGIDNVIRMDMIRMILMIPKKGIFFMFS